MWQLLFPLGEWLSLEIKRSALEPMQARVGGSLCSTKAPASPRNMWWLVGGSWGSEVPVRTAGERVGKSCHLGVHRGLAFMPFPVPMLCFPEPGERRRDLLLSCFELDGPPWETPGRRGMGTPWVNGLSCAGGKKSCDMAIGLATCICLFPVGRKGRCWTTQQLFLWGVL